MSRVIIVEFTDADVAEIDRVAREEFRSWPSRGHTSDPLGPVTPARRVGGTGKEQV